MPNIDTELPILANMRTDKELPIEIKSRIDALDPREAIP